MTGREHAEKLDSEDVLAAFRDEVVIADDVIYFDGNSLGRLPHRVRSRLQRVIDDEWGSGLVRSWHDWIELPGRAGDALGANVLRTHPGEVLVCDSVTVNLYKLATAAVRARPNRRVIVTDDDNFPTDRYILAEVARAHDCELRMLRTSIDDGLDLNAVEAALGDDVALVSFSHVAYRSGALAPNTAIDALAHEAGALTLWDLSHSVGSVPIDLGSADLAVGCTYKYVNAGPGAPGFLYVRRDLIDQLDNPVPGWFSHADQFAMAPDYVARRDIGRFLAGTPNILGTSAVEESAALLGEAGLDRLYAKGQALTAYIVDLVDAWPAGHGVTVATPRDPNRRGSHVVLEHPDAWRLAQALTDAGVIPDYREPNRLRLGPAPLYTRFVDVYDGLERLREILESGSHIRYAAQRALVT